MINELQIPSLIPKRNAVEKVADYTDFKISTRIDEFIRVRKINTGLQNNKDGKIRCAKIFVTYLLLNVAKSHQKSLKTNSTEML